MTDQPDNNVCAEPVYAALFRAHAPALRNFLYYRCGDAALAEDLCQEAFLKLWRECARVPFAKARAFLFAVATNLFLDNRRHRQVVLRFQQHQPKEPAGPESPQFQMETGELLEKLEKALAALPEHQRVVFLMNRIDNMTYADIAASLDLSVKAVEKRMHGALLALRQVLPGV